MSRALRQLLPSSGSSSEQPPPESQSSLSSSPRRRRVVRAACEACRHRKSRCDAERPICFACRKYGTSCIYQALPSETHSVAQRRKLRACEALYEILRRSSDEETRLVLENIRAGVDVEAIVQLIQEGDLLLQLSVRPDWRSRYEFPGSSQDLPPYLSQWPNPYLESKLYLKSLHSTTRLPDITPSFPEVTSQEKSYMVPYHAAVMADSRLDSIDVTKYTQVSSDRSLLRSLLEIYFLYEFPFNSFFHIDIFLNDMVSGCGYHCSPVLVNAVLASAWHGYIGSKFRAYYWQPNNLGYQFLSEAKRLLELERESPTLATVQAAGIINLVYIVNGTDDLGWQYLRAAVAMGHDIGLFTPSEGVPSRYEVASTTTAWALFNWQSFVCYHNFRYPLLQDPPPHPLPTKEQALDYFGDLSLSYPGSRAPTPIHHGEVFLFMCHCRVTMNSIAMQAYNIPETSYALSIQDAYRAHRTLHDWYNSLPEAISSQNITLPSHLKLHMQYHVLMVSIFEPFGRLDTPDAANSPKSIIGEAKANFETLLRLYYVRHGFESYDFDLAQYLPLLAFRPAPDATIHLSEQQQASLRSTILLGAKGLRDQGRNMIICKVIYHELCDLLKDPNLRQELAKFGGGALEEIPMLREVRSTWPVGIFNVAVGDRNFSLCKYLKEKEAPESVERVV